MLSTLVDDWDLLSGDERKALNSGCDAYVAKPISLHKFIEVVERFIGETGGPR
jgi:CheY-like chemotaxis protein